MNLPCCELYSPGMLAPLRTHPLLIHYVPFAFAKDLMALCTQQWISTAHQNALGFHVISLY